MYNQTYDLSIPTEIDLVFTCTSTSILNIEFRNTGENAFTSVIIKVNFVPDGTYQTWLSSSTHFDSASNPMAMGAGLHGENIYTLSPDGAGIISLKSDFLYSLKIEITSDDPTNVFVRAYGE